jgi:hypothetical protein
LVSVIGKCPPADYGSISAMYFCEGCGSRNLRIVPDPGPLDESFGPLGKHVTVLNKAKFFCNDCGELAGFLFTALGPICEVVGMRLRSRRN